MRYISLPFGPDRLRSRTLLYHFNITVYHPVSLYITVSPKYYVPPQPQLPLFIMRIAYVSADLGVPIFGRKGCSIHAQEVIRALVRRGSEVELFTTSGEGQPPEGIEAVRCHSLPRPPKSDPAGR